MPATDLETLFQFEDAIESAVVTRLSTFSVTAKKQRDDAVRATPLVSVQLIVGESAVDHEFKAPDGVRRYDFYKGTLRLVLVTARHKNNSEHLSLRAKIRVALSDYASALSLDYYNILDLRMASSTPTVEADNDFDISTMDYALEWRIKADAWPTAGP